MVRPPTHEEMLRFRSTARVAIAYYVLVICFGAVVRITGAGGGCGSDWPACRGDVLISPESTIHTFIEYTHRITSGLSLLLGLFLFFRARTLFGSKSRVTKAAIGTVAFLLAEAFIGAVIVKFELVESNDSIARAVIISLHLVNTLGLLACATSCAWFSTDPDRPLRKKRDRADLFVGLILVGIIFTSMTGAITALGDTLFLPDHTHTLKQAWADLSSAEHFLVRLRVIHPFVAAILGIASIYFAILLSIDDTLSSAAQGWARWILILTLVQIGLGVCNILLKAPMGLQLTHLLVADLLWIATWLTRLELRTDANQT